METVVGWFRASWKAIMPIVVLGLWELVIEVIDVLQDTWVDQPWLVVLLSAAAVWFKSNQPSPS